VELDGDLAVAAVERVGGQPRRRHETAVEHAGEDPEPVAAPAMRAADEAIRECVLAETRVVLGRPHGRDVSGRSGHL